MKKEDSRKTHAPFFKGKAVCKFDQCTSYDFTIKKTPKKDGQVKVRVKVSGKINHTDKVFRRHVTGHQREKMANTAKEKGPTETFYQNLSEANCESLNAGNYNNVPTKHALRQMLHEIISKELLDRDVYREIDIIDEVTRDLIPGGYVQYY